MNNILRLKTARINYSPSAGELVLDTTIKSGSGLGVTFAPTWDLVLAFKSGTLSWQQYTEGYVRLMRLRYLDNQVAFEQILNSKQVVVFTCYCNDCYENHHCHRYLLVDIFRKLAENKGIAFEYAGELAR